MKKQYDFSKGKRGAIEPMPPGKTRITIRLDNEIIEWFRNQVESRGGGNYQTMINSALKECIAQDTMEGKIKHIFSELISRVPQNNERMFVWQWTALSDNIRTDLQALSENKWAIKESTI